jgi:two-component system, NtrC family, sensor kinase
MTASLDDEMAELQRANAELHQRLDEALAREAATAEVLGVINSWPGDLAPVFDAILEKAHALCGVAYGSFLIRDGGEFCVVAAHDEDSDPNGESRYIAVREEHGRFRPPKGTPLWRVLNGERLVHLADAMADESYRHAPAYARVIDAGGIRTLLQVPLRKEDELLGVITAFRREVRPFSDKQIALLQNFAVQAVIAMENARLLGELRQRTGDLRESLEYQTATSDVLKVISRSTFDLQPVFETILATASRLCDADAANITNREGNYYRIVATFAASPEYDALTRGRLLLVDRGTITGRTALEGSGCPHPGHRLRPGIRSTRGCYARENPLRAGRAATA